MRDIQLFEKLIGVKVPWRITRIDVDEERKRIDFFIENMSGIAFPCPLCKQFYGVYDHAPEREFRHLNVFQMATYLHVRIPRVQCPTHGVQQIVHGLADSNGKITYELERLIIEWAHECSLESVCRILDVDWHLCQTIQERAVGRGFSRKEHKIPERIGVDEKSFARGHKYETIVYDIDKGTVDFVVDDRGQESLETYYQG